MLHISTYSCLEKITDQNLNDLPTCDRISVLHGEEFAYQIVVYNDEPCSKPYKIEMIRSGFFTIYLVGQVPVTWPHSCLENNGEYLIDQPGILPDVLTPIETGGSIMIGPKPTVLWISGKAALPGVTEYQLQFQGEEDEYICRFQAEAFFCNLIKTPFRVYEHIYATSIVENYRVPLHSSEFWDLLRAHAKLAAGHGVTDVLIPLYPVIYPSIGVVENIQLFTLYKTKTGYKFNYDLFDSWVVTLKAGGIEKFVLPPLFPDVDGGVCLPLKYTDEYGQKRPLFPKEMDCTMPEYHSFLCKFLRSFRTHLNELKLSKDVTFQVSDVMQDEVSDAFISSRDSTRNILDLVRVMDTVANLEGYHKKRFGSPIIPLHRFGHFMGEKAMLRTCRFEPEVHTPLADMFIAGNSTRLRSLGVFSYRNSLCDFFNRGFNFTGIPGEDHHLEHCLNLDAGNRFPSGALSLVYPGANGPVPSVRLKLLLYAFQDFRALEILEHFTSVENVFTMIDREYPVQPDRASTDAQRLLEFRNKVNRLIHQYANNKSEE